MLMPIFFIKQKNRTVQPLNHSFMELITLIVVFSHRKAHFIQTRQCHQSPTVVC